MKVNPPVRFFLLTLFLSVLLIFISFFFYQKKKDLWNEISILQGVAQDAVVATDLYNREQIILIQNHKNSDLNHFKNMLLQLDCCQMEKKRLKKLVTSAGFCGQLEIEKRYDEINLSPEITEKLIYSTKELKEKIISLKKPILIEEKDLASILNLIESTAPQTPYIELKDFHLKRIQEAHLNELFSLDLTLYIKEWPHE